jgi:hypothetical protein
MMGFKEQTWKITLYKRELQPDGRVADIEIESFDRARPKQASGHIQRFARSVVVCNRYREGSPHWWSCFRRKRTLSGART